MRLHQSEAASKVRMELISYIRGGMNEDEIQDRFAREYGERILGQPRGARSLVAYVVPYICGAVEFSPWRYSSSAEVDACISL